jgi:ABC-type branched-subunit amino acid transport system substrate-binding protein
LPYLKYAIDKGKKVFAVMYPGAIAGLKEGFVDPLQRYLDHHPEIDMKLVEIKQPFPASAADIDGAIAEMKSEHVDALFVATQPEGGSLTMQQAKLQGVGPDTGILWMFGPNFYDPKVAEAPDLAGTFVLSTNYPWEDTKNAEVKRMIKVTKGKVEKKDGFAIGGYASGALLERSMKGMKGKITSEALLAHWKTLTKVTAPLTPMKISFEGLNKNPSGGVILKFDNGEYVPVSDFITVPGKEFAP